MKSYPSEIAQDLRKDVIQILVPPLRKIFHTFRYSGLKFLIRHQRSIQLVRNHGNR